MTEKPVGTPKTKRPNRAFCVGAYSTMPAHGRTLRCRKVEYKYDHKRESYGSGHDVGGNNVSHISSYILFDVLYHVFLHIAYVFV